MAKSSNVTHTYTHATDNVSLLFIVIVYNLAQTVGIMPKLNLALKLSIFREMSSLCWLETCIPYFSPPLWKRETVVSIKPGHNDSCLCHHWPL